MKDLTKVVCGLIVVMAVYAGIITHINRDESDSVVSTAVTVEKQVVKKINPFREQRLLRESGLEKARTELDVARVACTERMVVGEIDRMNDHLKKAKSDLAAIGTSAQEVESLHKEGLFSQARIYLDTARAQCAAQSVEAQVNGVRNLIATSGKVITDLGIDDEGLDLLLLQGYVSEIAVLQENLVNLNDLQRGEAIKKIIELLQRSVQLMIRE